MKHVRTIHGVFLSIMQKLRPEWYYHKIILEGHNLQAHNTLEGTD